MVFGLSRFNGVRFLSATILCFFFLAGDLKADDVNWSALEKSAIEVDASGLSSSFKSKSKSVSSSRPEDAFDEKGEEPLPSLDESSLAKDEEKEEIPEEKPAFKLKNYQNVHYSRRLWKLSLFKNVKKRDLYERVKRKLHVTDFIEPELLKRYWTPKGILLSAFYYDYIKFKPNIAENFYRRFDSAAYVSFFVNRILPADYYLRTRRPGKILKILKRTDCLVNFKYSASCFYYIGIAKYVLTGNVSDELCLAASHGISMAKKICR